MIVSKAGDIVDVVTSNNVSDWSSSDSVEFVSWCFDKVCGSSEKDKLLGEYSDDCEKIRQNFFCNRRLYPNSPDVGDVVFFKNLESGKSCRLGIVYKVTDSRVYTAEGLISDSGEKTIIKKDYDLYDTSIYGYGKPLYGDPVEESVTEEKSDTFKVRVTSDNGVVCRKKPSSKSSKICSYTKGTELGILDVENNWGKCNDGWINLKNTENIE